MTQWVSVSTFVAVASATAILLYIAGRLARGFRAAHLGALFLLLFDLEAVFLVPWPEPLRALGPEALAAVTVFIAALLIVSPRRGALARTML
jgi:uncharacterized membrane protein